MPTNSQIPLPPTMQRCRWRWFWSHLHVVVTIKPIPPNNTNIKTPFFKQPNLNIWFHKEVLSNFKRRLGSLSSLEDFLSINAFLKVILMKKLWFFFKKLSIGFCIWCTWDVKPVYRKTKFIWYHKWAHHEGPERSRKAREPIYQEESFDCIQVVLK